MKKKEPCEMCDFMTEVNRVFGTSMKVQFIVIISQALLSARSRRIRSEKNQLRMLLLDVFMHKIAKDSKNLLFIDAGKFRLNNKL